MKKFQKVKKRICPYIHYKCVHRLDADQCDCTDVPGACVSRLAGLDADAGKNERRG